MGAKQRNGRFYTKRRNSSKRRKLSSSNAYIAVSKACEIAIQNIHKASNKLISEIDTYERECLSGWRATKESIDVDVEDLNKRLRAYLQRVQASETASAMHLDDGDKQRCQELNDRNKQLNAAMFNAKPFKKLDISSTELNAIDIRADFDFLLPLNRGQRIVLFKRCLEVDEFERRFTQMSCFDRFGRLLGINSLSNHVKQGNVAQCGPSTFVVCHFSIRPELSVYNTKLKLLRNVSCANFSQICCNSEFMFGLWDTNKRYDENDPFARYFTPVDDDDDQADEQHHSSQRIQMHHLDTELSKAFILYMPEEKYTMERLMADEHHLVAMSRLEDSEQWFMSVFDLSGRAKSSRRFVLAERLIELESLQAQWLPVFLLDGWLVAPHKKQLVWFDKRGERCETSTHVDLSDV